MHQNDCRQTPRKNTITMFGGALCISDWSSDYQLHSTIDLRSPACQDCHCAELVWRLCKGCQCQASHQRGYQCATAWRSRDRQVAGGVILRQFVLMPSTCGEQCKRHSFCHPCGHVDNNRAFGSLVQVLHQTGAMGQPAEQNAGSPRGAIAIPGLGQNQVPWRRLLVVETSCST